MKFLNKTDYNSRLFEEVYKVDLKKMMIVLRIAAILMGGFWGLEVFLEIINNSPVNPGNVYYVLLAVGLMVLSFYLPKLMARRQTKRLKRRGVDGVHTVRVYEDHMTVNYDNTGAQINFPLTKITRIVKMSDYFKVSIGGKSTYIDANGFEMGDAGDFYLFCVEYADANRSLEEEEVEASRARIRTAAGGVRKGLPYANANADAEGENQQPEEEFDEKAYEIKNPKSIFGKAMLNTGCDEEDEIDWHYVNEEGEASASDENTTAPYEQ